MVKRTSQRRLIAMAGSIGLLLATGPRCRAITFDFDAESAFDNNAGAGATMSASEGAVTVVMTSVDLLVPEYEEDPQNPGVFLPTGNTLSAADGDGVVTSIMNANNSLGINNPSITNAQFEDNFDPDPPINESVNFNLDEAWVFEFDTDLQITEFDFATLDDVDQFTVTVAGVAGSFVFDNSMPNDIFEDPLGGLVISAGTDITLRSTGEITGTVRIAEISVAPASGPGGQLIGDYNGNLIVDAADYTVWQDTLGASVPPGTGADGSGNGTVDQADYEAWKNHYGQTPSTGTNFYALAVPEPATAESVLIILLAIAGATRSARRA